MRVNHETPATTQPERERERERGRERERVLKFLFYKKKIKINFKINKLLLKIVNDEHFGKQIVF